MKKFFVISYKLQGDPVVYKVKDQADEPVTGIFYQEELQKVGEPDAYKIERVLKRKKHTDGIWSSGKVIQRSLTVL